MDLFSSLVRGKPMLGFCNLLDLDNRRILSSREEEMEKKMKQKWKKMGKKKFRILF